MKSNLIPMVGLTFGRLHVDSEVFGVSGANKDRKFLCTCICGGTTTTNGYYLRKGLTQSCGCLQKERAGEANRTHAMFGTKVYDVWANMKQRCTNPKSSNYNRYGGRDISVCDEWLQFDNFFKDMGEPPEGLTLERKNNQEGYSAVNCIWANLVKQGGNKRNNVLLTYQGKTQIITRWSEELGIPVSTLHNRIQVFKWSTEKALSTPARKNLNPQAV